MSTVHGRADGVHARGSLRPEEDVAMSVAPVVDMGHEECGRKARPRQPVQLVVTDGLGMDERMPAVRTGIFGLRRFQRIQCIVHGAVPVGMDKELSFAMRRLDNGEELLARIGGIAAVVRIAPERRS